MTLLAEIEICLFKQNVLLNALILGQSCSNGLLDTDTISITVDLNFAQDWSTTQLFECWNAMVGSSFSHLPLGSLFHSGPDATPYNLVK